MSDGKETLKQGLMALFDLAFKTRTSLPMLLSAAFMLFDLHFRLEVEVEARIGFQQQHENEEQQVENDEQP